MAYLENHFEDDITRAAMAGLAGDLWEIGENWQAARFYVIGYFARCGETVMIEEITDSEECEGAMDVYFERDGRLEVFTVWQLPNGDCYGEW